MEQKKKNIRLLISLGVLVLVSLGLLWGGGETVSDIDPAIFRLDDSKSVDRVTLEKPEEKITLNIVGGRWRVNDSWDADQNLIEVLFATVQQSIPKRKVPNALRDSLVSRIAQSGTKTIFYAGADKRKEFMVLGDPSSGLTYFMDPTEKVPYVMTIPGYRVLVAGIFEQESNAWRDKRIFNFNWRNFKSLEAIFPHDLPQGFSVAQANRYFSIAGEINTDTTILNNYLDAVSLIKAGQFYKKGESAKADSLTQTKPVMIITVWDVAGQKYALRLFAMNKGDVNALAQWGNDLVWIDRRNILHLYKKKKDFVKK